MKRVKGRGKKWDKMIAGIKAAAALGKITLITFSVRDMEDTARRLTMAELRNVRFTFLGMSLQRLALDAPHPAPPAPSAPRVSAQAPPRGKKEKLGGSKGGRR